MGRAASCNGTLATAGIAWNPASAAPIWRPTAAVERLDVSLRQLGATHGGLVSVERRLCRPVGWLASARRRPGTPLRCMARARPIVG